MGLGLELELEFEQELEVELELVDGEAGTGFLANMADRVVLELELELEPELEPEQELELGLGLGLGLWLLQVLGQVLWFEPGLDMTQVQGQRMVLVVSQASMECWAGQSSRVQAGWSVLAIQGTQFQTVTCWAKCC